MKRLMIWWMAAALVLTTATQLRLGGVPVGPGELMLVGWLAVTFAVVLVIHRCREPLDRLIWMVVMFWLALLVVLGGGFITRELMAVDDFGSASHDAMAFGFVMAACLGLAFTVRDQPGGRYAAGSLALLSAMAAALLLVLALTLRQVGPVQLWFGLVRFCGWSNNPNQFALLLVPVPFICIQLGLDSRTRFRRWFCFGCAVAVVLSGAATASDALMVAWVSGVLVLTGWGALQIAAGGSASRLTMLACCIVLPLAIMGVLIIYGQQIVTTVEAVLTSMYSDANQGGVRLTLWSNALAAWSKSPLVGFGPGTYSGYSGPFLGDEAHNTLLDWGASTGALGVCLLLILYVAVFLRILAARQLMLLLALISLLAFSLFHYVLRQPIFWAWLLLLYKWAQEEEHEVRARPAAADWLRMRPVGLSFSGDSSR